MKKVLFSVVVLGICLALTTIESPALDRQAIEEVKDINTTTAFTWVGDANNTLHFDIWEWDDEVADICFIGNSFESQVEFKWDANGMFDVVYDVNNCTAAASTFFECMLPYLNAHIEEKAKLLNKERKNEED